MPFPQTMSLLATCAFGLEAITRRELSTLGIEARIEGSGRVAFEGNNETMMRANLWLRTADRVLIRLAEMPCEDFDTLFETVKAMRWGDWLPVDASFPVKGRSIRSTLSSVPACQRAVKRAIVDAMRRDHGAATLAETGAEFKIEIGLLNNVATITVDTTGRSLHRRGYRTDISGAPLKETMAAALVLLTFWKPDRPLVDPFCGSGTIPIEAALIGRGIAPGRKRENAFMTWPNFNAELWSSLISDADANASEKLPNRLIGRDIDTRVLSAARDNAARAGVEDDVHFEPGDAVSFTSRRRFGCLISNPPYGMRLGGGSSQPDRAWNRNRQGDEQLDDLYASLPGMLRHLPTWSSYFLTAYPGFESVIGRSADRRRKLYNGRIECTYFQFHGPKPIQETRPLSDPSTLAASQTVTLVHSVGSAAFGQLDAKATHQAELFATRLRKRQKHLRRWPTRRGITCYRLYERDIPEIPLVVDRYEDHLHLIEFERPHDRDPAQHANWLDLMAKTAGECLEIPSKQVFLKRRGRQRGHDQHQRLAQSNHRLIVREGGLKFAVNLIDYTDTGLFLDHRVTRGLFRDEAKGKHVLNLFAYTGSFTVYAADGGAAATTSVDLSSNYLDWTRENLCLNGFDGPQHTTKVMDSREFLRGHPAGEVYDLVILDPPTFSNSKRTDLDWNVQNDAPEMLTDVLRLVRSGGVVFFSTNFRRFKMPLGTLSNVRVHELSNQTVPEDYRNRRIHRCWRIEKTTE